MWKNLRKKFNSTDSFVSLALGLAVVLVIGLTIINYVKNKSQDAASTAKEEAAAMVALPTTHTVAAGETLWSISEKYFKSGYNWVDIKNANTLTNPDYVEAGQTLTIPNATPIPPPTGAVSSASIASGAQKKSYTVVLGDDLWTIARREYNNGYRWVDIARANNLKNPNLIHTGNVLVLP